MITRRQFIEWSAATGAALLARQGWAVEAPTLLPAQPRVQPGFAVPAGACDTHVHILGAADRYPFVAKRAYAPPEASVDQLRALHRKSAAKTVWSSCSRVFTAPTMHARWMR